MANLVAIVGRPNVGKSTLFNRLTKTRQAIVNEAAGTTRDRQYGKCEWCGKEFSVVDTGGWVVNSDDIFEGEIRKQVLIAVEEADVILFVVDVMNGVTDLDMYVADILRRSKKKVLLIANKVDSNDLRYGSAEFYSLGLGEPYCVSAATGSGTGDMLDLILESFSKNTEEETEKELNLVVDLGGRFLDVFVYHRAYGLIRTELKIRSRHDVAAYMEEISSGKSRELLNITSGYHYHTIEADSEEILDLIQEHLQEMGFLAKLSEYEPIDLRQQAIQQA